MTFKLHYHLSPYIFYHLLPTSLLTSLLKHVLSPLKRIKQPSFSHCICFPLFILAHTSPHSTFLNSWYRLMQPFWQVFLIISSHFLRHRQFWPIIAPPLSSLLPTLAYSNHRFTNDQYTMLAHADNMYCRSLIYDLHDSCFIIRLLSMSLTFSTLWFLQNQQSPGPDAIKWGGPLITHCQGRHPPHWDGPSLRDISHFQPGHHAC